MRKKNKYLNTKRVECNKKIKKLMQFKFIPFNILVILYHAEPLHLEFYEPYSIAKSFLQKNPYKIEFNFQSND